MMRTLVSALAAAALAGCATVVVPPQAYHFDPTHPQAKPVADAAKVAPLTNRIAQLQVQLNEVRAQVAQQPDSFNRLALYERENRIHRELDPLQHELGQYASAR
jgi:hypothetical protein